MWRERETQVFVAEYFAYVQTNGSEERERGGEHVFAFFLFFSLEDKTPEDNDFMGDI